MTESEQVEAISANMERARVGLGLAPPKTATPRGGSEETKAPIIERIHPSELIREEMDARDWGIPSMARKMGGDYGINVLALEMYFSIGPSDPNLRLGDMAVDIARAFGTSVELFRNLEASWLSAPAGTT